MVEKGGGERSMRRRTQRCRHFGRPCFHAALWKMSFARFCIAIVEGARWCRHWHVWWEAHQLWPLYGCCCHSCCYSKAKMTMTAVAANGYKYKRRRKKKLLLLLLLL